VAEGTRLLSGRPSKADRGFESRPLRCNDFEFLARHHVGAIGPGEKVAATCPGAPTRISISLGFFCAEKRLISSEIRFDDVRLDAR
jgi:hypothetical protein